MSMINFIAYIFFLIYLQIKGNLLYVIHYTEYGDVLLLAFFFIINKQNARASVRAYFLVNKNKCNMFAVFVCA